MKQEAKAGLPPQQQRQPGRESHMHPQPEIIRADYAGSGKLIWSKQSNSSFGSRCLL